MCFRSRPLPRLCVCLLHVHRGLGHRNVTDRCAPGATDTGHETTEIDATATSCQLVGSSRASARSFSGGPRSNFRLSFLIASLRRSLMCFLTNLDSRVGRPPAVSPLLWCTRFGVHPGLGPAPGGLGGAQDEAWLAASQFAQVGQSVSQIRWPLVRIGDAFLE